MYRVLIVALAACGPTPQQASTPPAQPAPVVAPPSPPPVAEEKCKPTLPECILPKMESFRDQMCACQDKACAEKVNDAMTVWGKAMSKDRDAGKVPPTDEQQKLIVAAVTAYGECMTKAMTAN